jgi:sugar/nucleoside kinase (ribokinase family)
LAFGELIQDVIVAPVSPLTYGGGHVDGDIAFFRGGCGPNVVAGCAELGVPSRLIAHHGDDAVGVRMANQLQAAGVDVVAIRRGRTASSLSVATPAGDTALVFSPGDSRSVTAVDIDPRMLDGVDFVHLNSHHLYSRETRGAFLKLADFAHEVGAKLSIDVSAANRLARYGVERYRNALKDLRPDFLLSNRSEAETLRTLDDYPAGVGLAIVHSGTEPTVCFSEGEVVHVEPVRAVDCVVDTTGAGDAFAAGFLTGLYRGETVQASVKLAHQLAADSVVRLGVEFPVEGAFAQSMTA